MTRPKKQSRLGAWMERFSGAVTRWSGSSVAFTVALLTIVAWGITGPMFHYSDTWQLVINTGTTIVTFLMVFLIQRSQNKESMAIQLKLNELVAAIEGASNRLVAVEDLCEDELHTLQEYYSRLVELAKQEESLTMSHSIDEAHADHERKLSHARKQRKSTAPDG